LKITEADIELKSELSSQYDDRELDNISKIFWEDLFGYRGGIDRHLHSKEMEIYEDALQRLKEGEPIQYVTGLTYFYNVKLNVNKHVLIPRPETEELVHCVLSDNLPHGTRVLDVGTGSGCIPIVLKRKRADMIISAIDKSKEALKVAKRNAEKNEVKIKFLHIDFMSELAWENFGLFDVIVSNPPYISPAEKSMMSASTLNYEPDLALFPEHEDVLIFYKMIAKFAKEHLAEQGRIYLECNEFNAKEVAGLFQNAKILQDMQGKDRIVNVQY
jgi:release factor glutamine methyltransferase